MPRAWPRNGPLSPLEQQGFIKAFEFTNELAWNVMKDYFEYQGNTAITGSRDAIREAFRRGLVTDGEAWMETIASRNRSSQTYDENTAQRLIETISRRYLTLFNDFQTRMRGLPMMPLADSTPDTSGLSPTVIDRIRTVLGACPAVERALLYGSRAKGNYHRGSDIDLALEGQQLDDTPTVGTRKSTR
jgi:nucleotidyltransferase substrate binding protein (TIGR01987 family)